MQRQKIAIRLDASTHHRNEALVNDTVEHGGGMKLELSRGMLIQSTPTRSGRYDAVPVPEAVVQFHTHPASCNDDICAMSIPSTADIMGYARAVLKGKTQMHLVYTKDGTYIVWLPMHFRRRLLATRDLQRTWLEEMNNEMTLFRAQHRVTSANYDDFRQKWLAKVREQGVRLTLVPLGVVPEFWYYSP